MAGFASDNDQKPIELSLDLRVQHALRDELVAARAKYKAIAAAGIITDVRTGEIIAMVSLPDYDANNPKEALDPTRINRLTTGVYEMGSTFKALTIGMGLDSGKMNLSTTFDARMPLRYGKFNISDYHAQNRVLTIPEIFTYSSNIGAARVALRLGSRNTRHSCEDGSARPAAHRTAGKRGPDCAEALGRVEHDHHCVRPRSLRGAIAVGDGRGRADERRLADPADLPQAQRKEARRSPSRW